MGHKKSKTKEPITIIEKIDFLMGELNALDIDTVDLRSEIVGLLPAQRILVIPEATWTCPSCGKENKSAMHYDDDGVEECSECGLNVLLEQP